VLSGVVWDEGEVRDAARGFVARYLGEGGVPTPLERPGATTRRMLLAGQPRRRRQSAGARPRAPAPS
jgi:hypothetical protein